MERMAKLLDVSTSGYYGWFSRPESEREQERLLLDVLVKAACEASRGRYGSLKISRACGRECDLVSPRSASRSATGLLVIEVPRSACRVNWPEQEG